MTSRVSPAKNTKPIPILLSQALEERFNKAAERAADPGWKGNRSAWLRAAALKHARAGTPGEELKGADEETAEGRGLIHVLAMPAEKAEIEKAADAVGMTTGAFVRAAGAIEARTADKKKS